MSTQRWLTIGGTDLTFVVFALRLGIALFLPRMSVGERTLWLWFAAGFMLAIFFTEKPRTHVYTFFLPWLLLCGWSATQLWTALCRRTGTGTRTAVVVRQRCRRTVDPVGRQLRLLVLRPQPDRSSAHMGRVASGRLLDFLSTSRTTRRSSASPWPTAGRSSAQLYEQGVISGDYETNEKEAWVPAWYTRGQFRCGRSADWYFEIDNLEPWDSGDQAQMEHFLRHGFSKWGIVEINETDRLVIYQRTGEQSDMPTQEPRLTTCPAISWTTSSPASTGRRPPTSR